MDNNVDKNKNCMVKFSSLLTHIYLFLTNVQGIQHTIGV